jgi:hypothetical protein
LQGRGYRFLIRLGPPHFRVEALVDLAQGGIVRAYGGQRAFGLLRFSKAGWLAEFFVFVAVHDSDRPTIQVHFSPCGQNLTAGKLDLPFCFSRHAIAGRGTISPGAHGSQNIAVTRRSGALKNQRTMHPAVRTDDKADFNP